MRALRVFGVALAIVAAACSQAPQSKSEAPPASAESPAQDALSVLTPLIAAEIGKPITLQASTSNVKDGWAYIVAVPRNSDGSAIDWSTTNLASRHENGVMDESGAVHALLQQQNGVWVVVEHVTAPTDVAWVDWATKHNVPAGVVDVPVAP